MHINENTYDASTCKLCIQGVDVAMINLPISTLLQHRAGMLIWRNHRHCVLTCHVRILMALVNSSHQNFENRKVWVSPVNFYWKFMVSLW